MLRRFYHRLLPDAQTTPLDRRRRGERLVAFDLAMLFWVPVFVGVYLSLEAPYSASVVFCAGLLLIANLALFRRTGRDRLCGNLIVGIAWGTYTALAVINGGHNAPSTMWYATVPVLAITLAGSRAGLGWSLLSVLAVSGLYALRELGLSLPNELTANGMRFLQFSALLGMMLCVHVLMLLFYRLEREAQRSIGEALTVAQAADRSKSEFLANMSHEIRTPMTSILGYAELLQQGDLEGPLASEALVTIRRNGEHLLAIINDILDVSKIEAGKLIVERRPCRPRDLLEEVVQLMQPRADAKGLPLELEVDDSLPETILTDATRLRQILINLVGNALKFTEDGSVSVQAQGIETDGPAPRLRVAVQDTGIGMTLAQATRVFEPFQQADSSTTRRFGGTGLGLAISRRLAEMLGGGIQVVSAPDSGTTFTLTIDAASAAYDEEPSAIAAAGR
jgi:signal transduction histidine kinase